MFILLLLSLSEAVLEAPGPSRPSPAAAPPVAPAPGAAKAIADLTDMADVALALGAGVTRATLPARAAGLLQRRGHQRVGEGLLASHLAHEGRGLEEGLRSGCRRGGLARLRGGKGSEPGEDQGTHQGGEKLAHIRGLLFQSRPRAGMAPRRSNSLL